MKNITVWDNNGETFDRFTILDNRTGEMLGASENPFHPMGFGQYCGNAADNYWFNAYGYTWRKCCDKGLLRRRIKFAIEHLKADSKHMGEIVDYNTLPDNVKKFISERFSVTANVQ